MSIHLYIPVVLLISTILSNVNSQNGVEQYLIRKDFFSGIKAAQFTVYDPQEKHVYCRIESKFGLLQNIKVIAYPSKQEIGRLKAKPTLLNYKAEISIFDRESNEWVSGFIEKVFKWTSNLYTITWGENRITMDNAVDSGTHIFRDSDGGEILAQFGRQPGRIFSINKFNLQIFSKKYPKQIYLLGYAAYDFGTAKRG